MTLVLTVGADGSVSDVKASATGIPASSYAVQCMRARAGAARFSAPKSGSATITFAVQLTRT